MLESPTVEVKRLTVDLSADEHRQLKLAAVHEGTTVRELVLRALRREGVIGKPREGAFQTQL